LSLATSGSQSYAITQTSNNSVAILTGLKGLTLPLAANMTPGNYWMGMWSSTASANANWATLSNICASQGPLTYNGLLGSSSTVTGQGAFGGGYWSATSAALPSSIAFSNMTGVANIYGYFNIYNVTA
jgi:hypothetical protein